MKKIIFFAAFVAVAMTSCLKEESVTTSGSSNDAVSFSTFISNSTKAIEVENDTFTEFGLDAYFTNTTGWSSLTASSTIEYFMNKQVVTRTDTDAANTWTYSPLKYYPNDNSTYLSFFGYSPMTYGDGTTAITLNKAAEVDKDSGRWTLMSYGGESAPTLTDNDVDVILEFTVPTDSDDQVDLVVAQTTDCAKVADAVGSVNTIMLQFSHILSQLALQIECYDSTLDSQTAIVVNSVEVGFANATVQKSGLYSYNDNAWYYNSSNTYASSFTYELLSSSETASGVTDATSTAINGTAIFAGDRTSTATTATTTGTYTTIMPRSETENNTTTTQYVAESMMFIPQTLSSGNMTCTITYTVYTHDNSSTFNANNCSKIVNKAVFNLESTLAMGTKYYYTVKVDLTSVKVNASLGSWTEASGVSVEIPSTTTTDTVQ